MERHAIRPTGPDKGIIERQSELPPIAEALSGKRIGVTGATGFLGTALLERLLRSAPGCEVIVLVRGSDRKPAEGRVKREILGNDAFGKLIAELGEKFDEEMSSRLRVVQGDVAVDGLGFKSDQDRDLFKSCDTVIHSAANVSFDTPLDEAIEINLLGPARVAKEIGDNAHFIPISTAYVSSNRRGRADEQLLRDDPFQQDLDVVEEVDNARRMRSDLDAKSREAERLASFTKDARRKLGAGGSPLIVDEAEDRRKKWVNEQLVEAGRARAKSLGWPDVYAYTKALGEKALLAERDGKPVTIVRPSIIESAVAEPSPGWIRGFRMADPIIMSYGKGILKEFPGLPEGIVDVIPVDYVVSAVMAVAAKGPDKDEASVYHVASGATNPLTSRRFIELLGEYFDDNPLYDNSGQPIPVPKLEFTQRGKTLKKLESARTLFDKTRRIAGMLPLRGALAERVAGLEDQQDLIDGLLKQAKLYGSYAETEAVFDVSRLLTLWDSLNPADRDSFQFDPRNIDWYSYIQDHVPQIIEKARASTGKRKTEKGPTRYEKGVERVLSKECQAAVFDLENTLLASNVVESYAWLASRQLPQEERPGFVLRTLAEVPSLLKLDHKDRGDFLRHFYRRYKGASLERLQADAREMLSEQLLVKSFPEGIRRVREHRKNGHKTVLITGALDFIVEPLKPLFDEIICPKMRVENGILTGELDEPPPVGEARVMVLQDYAAANGLDLSEIVAYADSTSDLALLEAVGHPVAVNAEPKLISIARGKKWHIENWKKSPGAPRRLLPLATIGKRK